MGNRSPAESDHSLQASGVYACQAARRLLICWRFGATAEDRHHGRPVRNTYPGPPPLWGCCVNGAFGFGPPGPIDAVAVVALQGDGRRAIFIDPNSGQGSSPGNL